MRTAPDGSCPGHRPSHALAKIHLAKVFAAGFGGIVLFAVLTRCQGDAPKECSLERNWYAGDFHHHATLFFSASGTGEFATGVESSVTPRDRRSSCAAGTRGGTTYDVP